MSNLIQDLGRAANSLGKAVDTAAKQAAKTVEGIAKEVEKGAAKVAHDAGGALEDLWTTGTRAAADGAAAIVGGVGRGINEVERYAGPLIGTAMNIGDAVVSTTGELVKSALDHDVRFLVGVGDLVAKDIRATPERMKLIEEKLFGGPSDQAALSLLDIALGARDGLLDRMPESPLASLLQLLDQRGGLMGREPSPAFDVPPIVEPSRGHLPRPIDPGFNIDRPTAPKPNSEQVLLYRLIALVLKLLSQIQAGGQTGGAGGPSQAPGASQNPEAPTSPAAGSPVSNAPGGAASGNFREQIFGQIRNVGSQIESKKQELLDPKLTPDERTQKQLELQELLQQRQELIEMLTNLMKTEHDENMAVIRNLAL